MKQCARCQEVLPTERFSRNRTAKDGLLCYCKTCHRGMVRAIEQRRKQENPELFRKKQRERNKRWRTANLEKSRAASRNYYGNYKLKFREYEAKHGYKRSLGKKVREYGITVEQYKGLLEKFDHKCGICRREHREDRTLNLDHCHTTGEIRGLLCGPCNKALGAFGDTLDGLMKAVAFLKSGGTGLFVGEKRRKLDANPLPRKYKLKRPKQVPVS
jgi:hypothetical protein